MFLRTATCTARRCTVYSRLFSSASEPLTVVISGAGIAGLTLANALSYKSNQKNLKLNVILVDKAPKLDPRVGGVISMNTAVPILASLGFQDSFDSLGMPLEYFHLFSGEKKLLSFNMNQFLDESIGLEFTKNFPKGAISWFMRRGDLLAKLASRAEENPDIEFHLGDGLENCIQNDFGVEVTLMSGKVIKADTLIGCDGIKSVTRRIIHGSSIPKFSGHVLCGGVSKLENRPEYQNSMWQWMAKDGKSFIVAPGDVNGHLVWGIGRTASAPNHNKWLASGDFEECRRLSKSFPSDVQEIVNSTVDPTSVTEFGLYYRKHVNERSWYKGRIGMIGDASHATLPWIGQGANMAICDAACLANELTSICDQKPTTAQITAALRATEERRVKNVKTAVVLAKYIGIVLHSENRFVQIARDYLYPKMFTSPSATKQLWKDLRDCSTLLDGPTIARVGK